MTSLAAVSSDPSVGFDHCAIAAFFVLGVVNSSRCHRLHTQRSAESKLPKPNQTKPTVSVLRMKGMENKKILLVLGEASLKRWENFGKFLV